MTILMREDVAAAIHLGTNWRGRIHLGLAKALEGDDNGWMEKALAADDAYSVPDGDNGVKRDPACPVCGLITIPGAMTRHKVATGHGAPAPRTENASVASGFLAKSANAEQRYTLSPLYLPNTIDAHGEFATADDLQESAHDYFRSGNRQLRKQHGREVIGEIVEMLAWPYDHEASLSQANGTVRKQKLPAGTVYVGVKWSPSAWQDVKSGAISGLSMGGSCVRVKGPSS
jgi:hypothetical protein